MAYTIKRTDGTTLAVVADGSANTSTELTLIGKNYLNYGTALNENFIKLLENFSNTTAPIKAIRGQLWYDIANGDLKIYNGNSWVFTSTKANTFTATGTITGGNLDTAGNLNVTVNANVGNLSSSGAVSATGNITGGNLSTAGVLSVTGNANIGNLGTGIIIATGNITGANINTAGTVTASRLISNVATGSSPFVVTSTTQVANLNAATSGTAVTVTAAAQPNITSVGTLTSLTVTNTATVGNLSTAGTVTASRLISNVATGTAPFTVTSTTQVANLNAATAGSALTAGTVTTAAQPNITSVGTLTGLTSAGNVVPSANATYTLGTSTLRWSNVWGVSSSALYADLAEKYHADDVYSPGTVMCLGGNNEVTKSTKDLDENVFGVVSTNPAYLMNDNNEHPLWLPIVLTGRANVMVTGTVTKGQWLVSAGDGTARAAREDEVKFNLVIGRSLVNKTINSPALVEAYISTK